MNSHSSDFHITIGAGPDSNISLEKDLRMIKAALLYADKVKLYSLNSSMLLSMLLFREFNRDQQIEFVESIVPIFFSDREKADQALTLISAYKNTFHGRKLTNEELLIRAKFNPIFTRMWVGIRDKLQTMLESAGMVEFITVLETGLLEAHIFGADYKKEPDDQTGTKYNAAIIKEFSDVLEATVNNNTTYPLFDDQTGNIVRLGLKEGKYVASQTTISRGKHAGLAAQLLERLPLFEEASVNEVLDIRRELESPLIRFRGAVIKFSDSVKTASWDEDFSAEAEQVFQRDVAPAILDIEEAVKANSYMSQLTRKLVDKPLTIASGSALALIMSQLKTIPDLFAQSLGIGVGAGVVAYDAFKEWEKQQRDTEGNGLFFYYRAGKLLSERQYEYVR